MAVPTLKGESPRLLQAARGLKSTPESEVPGLLKYDDLETETAAMDRWACPKAHISPKAPPFAVLEVATDGRAVRSTPIKRKARQGQADRPLKKRGCIKEFSRQSRMRLLWQLANLKGGSFKPALFITLTYPPGEFEPRETKRHLDNFLKRVRRRWPSAAGLWKLEYQQNGTAHYHVLLLGVWCWSFVDVRKCWAQVVKSNHPKYEIVSTNVDLVVSQRQAAMYMGKYITKRAPVPANHYGRVWGCFGELDQFESGKVVIGLDRSQVVQLRRLFDTIRRHGSKRRFRRASDLEASQRWFMEGSSAMVIVGRLFDLDLGNLVSTDRAASGVSEDARPLLN